MSQIEFEISGRCKRFVYRLFLCSTDRRRRKAINANDSYETREREKEGEKETKKDKRKKRCMPSFEYVSMHILPGAIRKDFRKILKCCNSRQAKAGHCIGRIDTMYSDAVISSIIIIQLH